MGSTLKTFPAILTDVWVPGPPRTKGSLTVVNAGSSTRKAHVSDTAESRRWRALIVERVRDDRASTPGRPLDPFLGAVHVSALFHQRVEDVTRKVAGSGDLDKLIRNVLDALSWNIDPTKGAGVYRDDMQVSYISAGKIPADPNRGPGLMLCVRTLP